MASAGIILAVIVCCVLVIVGTVLGVYFSKVACPDFGSKCPSSPAPKSPGPAPGPAPSTPGSLISTSTTCPAKAAGTYYTDVNGCATAACKSAANCPAIENATNTITGCRDALLDPIQGNIYSSAGVCDFTCNSAYTKSRSGSGCVACVTEGSANADGTNCCPGSSYYGASGSCVIRGSIGGVDSQ